MSLLTDLDDPQPMGISLSDHLAGIFAAYGVLAALAARERTGEGQRVDTSLLQSSTSFLAENMARFLHDGAKPPTRRTRARTAQVYAVKDRDGRPFVVHLSSPDKFWRGLLTAIDRTDLLDDPRFADRAARIAHREDIQALLDDRFATASREEWLARLSAADVPSAPLNSLADVVEDEQIRHLGLIREVEHPTRGPDAAARQRGQPARHPTTIGPAPLAGEDTAGVLAELGLPEDYLDDAPEPRQRDPGRHGGDAAMTYGRSAAIVGAAHSQLGEVPGSTAIGLMADAAVAAVADAGLTKRGHRRHRRPRPGRRVRLPAATRRTARPRRRVQHQSRQRGRQPDAGRRPRRRWRSRRGWPPRCSAATPATRGPAPVARAAAGRG